LPQLRIGVLPPGPSRRGADQGYRAIYPHLYPIAATGTGRGHQRAPGHRDRERAPPTCARPPHSGGPPRTAGLPRRAASRQAAHFRAQIRPKLRC